MLTQITPPIAEPVSLAELKQHVGIDSSQTVFDAQLTAYGIAARDFCEKITNRQFVQATYLYTVLQPEFVAPWNYLTPAGLLLPSIYATQPFPRRGIYDQTPYSSAAQLELPRAPLISVTQVQYWDANLTLQTLSELPHEWWARPTKSIMLSEGAGHGQKEVHAGIQTLGGSVG